MNNAPFVRRRYRAVNPGTWLPPHVRLLAEILDMIANTGQAFHVDEAGIDHLTVAKKDWPGWSVA